VDFAIRTSRQWEKNMHESDVDEKTLCTALEDSTLLN
jgi:hypothetical protein